MKTFPEFVNALKRMGLEYFNRFYSVYPGIVIDNNDPEKRGRIKVKVPSVLGDINGGVHESWVVPHHNNLAGAQTGAFFPPYVEDIVDVMFQLGDLNYPIYKGGFWHDGELPGDFTAGYPNVRGWVFKSGQKIIIDESAGKFRMVFSNPSGSQVVIDDAAKSVSILDNAGDSVILSNGTITVKDKAGDSIQVGSGQMTATVKQLVSLLTKKVILGEDVMSAVLGENLESWGDTHTHIWPGGLVPAPTTPPIIPNSARTGTALDYKSLFIKLKGNT